MGKSNNLDDFLTDLANTIREKKGTNEPINAQDFSSEIASIQSGGRDWGEIGYDSEPQFIEDCFVYAKKIAEEWDSSRTSMKNMYSKDKELAIFPLVDVSSIKSTNSAFDECRRLIYCPQFEFLDNSNANRMFRFCTALKTIEFKSSVPTSMQYFCTSCASLTSCSIITPSITNASNMFTDCYSLEKIPPLNTSATTIMGHMFQGCSSLISVQMLDIGNATQVYMMFNNCTNLRYAKLLNMGKSTLAIYNFGNAPNWGVANEEIPDARESLIDSLITYSYDRASNGMATATITLSANTKALLTEEEIAQITAKGFTIA